MADEPQFGTWQEVGAEPFVLDPSIPAVRYRWTAPPKHGQFSVDFQSTECRPERRFYPAEVLDAVRCGEPADGFAERVCEFGIDLLPHMEETCRDAHAGDAADPGSYADKRLVDPDTLRFLFAIFRSRATGRSRVTRKFGRADDFFDTRASRFRPEPLVPGITLPRSRPGEPRPDGMAVIRLIREVFAKPAMGATVPAEAREEQLDISPVRTPLDQYLVAGVFRDEGREGQPSFWDIQQRVAPAVIDRIDLWADTDYLAERAAEYRAVLRRLVGRHFAKPAGYQQWLAQEREKGFVRLLPGHKRMNPAGRERARETGTRAYRRTLWTAYEVMARCYGVAALWMWLSFCRCRAIDPAKEEQWAFRCYNSPLVCAGGLPLWFYGYQTYSWIFETLAELVWKRSPDAAFDCVSTLLGLYGHAATQRRLIDTEKKQRTRARVDGGLHPREHAEQYERTPGGDCLPALVPTTRPADVVDEIDAYPVLPTSLRCPCGGQLGPARETGRGSPATIRGDWVVVATECTDCGIETEYRQSMP